MEIINVDEPKPLSRQRGGGGNRGRRVGVRPGSRLNYPHPQPGHESPLQRISESSPAGEFFNNCLDWAGGRAVLALDTVEDHETTQSAQSAKFQPCHIHAHSVYWYAGIPKPDRSAAAPRRSLSGQNRQTCVEVSSLNRCGC